MKTAKDKEQKIIICFDNCKATTDVYTWLAWMQGCNMDYWDAHIIQQKNQTFYTLSRKNKMPATTSSPNDNYNKFITGLAIAILAATIIGIYLYNHLPY